ncbi:hypothetical protein LMG19087_03015 [Ralstonia wenshanensis]|uniref:ETEC_3214 domain-containing protein n=1 Tax=Ralstonia wenshanensis TaxID=2842456 RepID=UPI0028F4E3C2|nr:ETEC_3214 domain-containing protein [Ralstonia wenshanensis]CAJ0817192.1 hypothetical protein LMG19087_03015 [Ralstonia wenshanensis]
MFDPMTYVAKEGAGWAKSAFGYFRDRYFPKRLSYQIAPPNILEVVSPYVHRDKVIELLGRPHRLEGNTSAYRFKNALLQIEYENDNAVTVTLASLQLRWPNRFEIFPLGLKMGSSTFGEVSVDPECIAKVENSSKFFAYWTKEYFGFPGRYMNYYFGMIEAATHPPLKMPKGETEAVGEIDDFVRFYKISKPSKTKFNIVCVSAVFVDEREIAPSFSWEFFS